MQTRAKLEGLAAGWAARKYTKSAGCSLKKVVDALKEVDPGDPGQEQRLRELHAAFHTEIRALAQNPFVDRFVRLMVGIDESMRRRALSFAEAAARSWREHFEIYEAIVAGDEARAASLTEAHVLRSLDFVVDHMEGAAAAPAAPDKAAQKTRRA